MVVLDKSTIRGLIVFTFALILSINLFFYMLSLQKVETFTICEEITKNQSKYIKIEDETVIFENRRYSLTQIKLNCLYLNSTN
jgi:hypothetical protein